MGKYEKKQVKKSPKGSIIALVLVIVLATLTLFGVLYSRSAGMAAESFEQNTDSQASVSVEDESLLSVSEIVFPVVLEDGWLEVESVFQYSGINPDADGQKVSEAASIVLKNASDAYLKSATIRAMFHDGSERIFEVYDLPAGKAVIAVSADNSKMAVSDVCTAVYAESVFEDVRSVDGAAVSVDGMTVTLENVSGEDLSGIDVYCRDVFEDKYFGSTAYKYSIDELPAGGTVTVIATDCILGAADVVRIAVNDQK